MLVVALAPSIALLTFIYQKDRYDKEPPILLTKLFIYGVLSVFPVYFAEKFVSGLNQNDAFFQAFIVAGLIEEFFKFYIVFKIAFNSKHYNEKLDGIVYCVFTSLGFATAENILYIFNVQTNYLFTGIIRALLSVPAHMLFAITMGYYISLAKYSRYKEEYIEFISKALIIPIILHGIYDYILFSRIFNYFIVLIVFVIYLWSINLSKLNRYVNESKEENKQ